jgi:hypothetical protein
MLNVAVVKEFFAIEKHVLERRWGQKVFCRSNGSKAAN